VCIACVMNTAPRQPAPVTDPGDLPGWSPGDTAKAATVYRQLPRWSRRLFDLLSSAPGQRFPRSAVELALTADGEHPFGVDEVCDWAAVFCAASSRPLPVHRETLPLGQAAYSMEQPAAGLFQGLNARTPP
jgi:hypothetical protein